MTAPQKSLSMLDAIVGASDEIRQLRRMIERVAPTKLPVMIQGPTGSGKELVARALHEVSERPGRLVAFNVCALGEPMFEDALFGHVRGAFTGAVHDAPGYLSEADRGTVFIDEIGGLPLAAQAKLLRALETGEYRPVGAKADRKSDFRVIAATNDDVGQLVAGCQFRADLAHRLGGFTFQVPALADRQTDIPLLAQHFLTQAGAGRTITISDAATDLLIAHPWPGNVRELKYVMERSLLHATGDSLSRGAVSAAFATSLQASAGSKSFARRRLVALLEATEWDTNRAARELGVHRATLYRQMKQLAITVPTHRTVMREPSVASDAQPKVLHSLPDRASELPARR